MNKFFKSAVDRYNKLKGDKDFLINPISEEDAEIIDELRVILKKLGRDDVLELLRSHKEEKDVEIRDKLLQWNIDHPSLGLKGLVDKVADDIVNGNDSEKQQWQFFKIDSLSIRSYHLLGFEEFEKNDKFYIKINPTPDHAKSIPLYANYLIEYESEEYRNQVIENLQNFLGDQGVDTIEM